MTLDLIDIKTGSVPATVGAQTMGYRRRLGLPTTKALTYDDATHTYRLDDQRVLSVTQALKVLSDEAVAEYYTEESSRRGTELHAAVEAYVCGVTPRVSETVAPYWTQFLQFARTSGFNIWEAEQFVQDDGLGYAGRFDLLGTFDDAGLGLALHWPTVAVRRWVLQLTPERPRLDPLNLTPGTMRVDRAIDRRDEQLFLNALGVAQWRLANIKAVTT